MNKDGQYQCKKHGSTCAFRLYILKRLPLSLTISYPCSVQPMLRMEEADHQGESGRQEGGQKGMILAPGVSRMGCASQRGENVNHGITGRKEHCTSTMRHLYHK